MAVLAYDDVMLREPRLLVPRQCPVGPVRIDPSHPMAWNLAWAYGLFQSKWEIPLAGNRAATLTRVTAAPKASQAGLGLVATTRLSLNDVTDGGIITSDGTGSGDFAVLIHAAPQSVATARTLWHQRNATGSPYNSVIIRANSYYADGSSSTTTSAGYFYFGTFSATVNARGIAVEARVNGLPHCWLGVRRGGVFGLYEDGTLLGTNDQSANVVDVYASGAQYSIGCWTILDTTPATEPIHFVVGWNYAPPAAWCQELSRDPYSLLIPA